MENKVRKVNSIWARMWKARVAYLFLLPLFAGLIIFAYYPPVYGLFLSLTDKVSFGDYSVIGLDNFVTLFKDEVFLSSILTMFKIMIPRLIIGIFAPLIMAEMIFCVHSQKLKGAFRVSVLIPIVAPGVVSMLIWRNIYDPTNGVLNSILRILGIIEENKIIDWLGTPNLVIPAIIFIGFPWMGGTNVLIYTSGLMGISTRVIEASKLDGASTMCRILKIDLPLLKGQLKYFLVFGIITGLQDYGTQYVLTDGGPGYATYVPGYYMYKQSFVYDKFGYAAAIGTVIFLFTAIFSVIAFRSINTNSDAPEKNTLVKRIVHKLKFKGREI